MKLKGLHFADVSEIQEAVNDELKKSKKMNIRQVFRNCTTAQNPVYMPTELILNIKKGMCLRFLKKSVLKLLDRTVYVNIKFHENPSSGRLTVACGWTDRHDEANIRFLQFCERA
jgi:hypothetical protein